MRSVAKQVVRRRSRRGKSKVAKHLKGSKTDWLSILMLVGVVLIIIAVVIADELLFKH